MPKTLDISLLMILVLPICAGIIAAASFYRFLNSNPNDPQPSAIAPGADENLLDDECPF